MASLLMSSCFHHRLSHPRVRSSPSQPAGARVEVAWPGKRRGQSNACFSSQLSRSATHAMILWMVVSPAGSQSGGMPTGSPHTPYGHPSPVLRLDTAKQERRSRLVPPRLSATSPGMIQFLWRLLFITFFSQELASLSSFWNCEKTLMLRQFFLPPQVVIHGSPTCTSPEGNDVVVTLKIFPSCRQSPDTVAFCARKILCIWW